MIPPPVTFMIMIFNQAKYIVDAVQSAFGQEYDGPLEILLSDDASTDGTTELLRKMVERYDGPHSVRLSVNRSNLGLMAHFNKVFALARHDLVVCGAGDVVRRFGVATCPARFPCRIYWDLPSQSARA